MLMIGSLRGLLVERDAKGTIIVETAGVGYLVNATTRTVATIGDIGSEVSLRVHTRVREDAITLFGFTTNEEKRCFEVLIGAHGVGPAMALALLSMHGPSALRQIVLMEDVAALAQVPGIGKKTAARLLVELKAKFDLDFDAELVDITSTTPGTSVSNTTVADVTAALTGLGFGGDEIRRVVATLPREGSAEELLRLALRELAVS